MPLLPSSAFADLCDKANEVLRVLLQLIAAPRTWEAMFCRDSEILGTKPDAR